MSVGSKRRWYQFSIRSLLVLMTLVALGFGFWVSGLHRRHQALNAMRTVKARIEFARGPTSRFAAAWNGVLSLAGDDYASEPVAISIVPKTVPPPNDAAVALLADLPSLKRLSLRGPAAGDEGMPYLRRLMDLERLDLSWSQADDRALANLSALANLQSLNLEGTQVSDLGMQRLEGLSQLTGLQLNGTRVGDEALKTIARLPRLQDLSLKETPVTGSGFAPIAQWPGLKALDLSGSALTDEGLMKLPRAPALHSLKLNDTAISDRGAKQLGRLAALQALELRNTKISGKSLQRLQSLRRLTYLDLTGTQIGDADIESLNQIGTLVSVSLARTSVTAAGLAKLRAVGSLDDTSIVLRGLAEETEINCTRQPLADVIDSLRQRHECEIQFDARLVKERRQVIARVTCNVRGVSLWRGLQELVGPLGLEVVFRYSVPYITKLPAKPALGIPEFEDGEKISAVLAAVLSEKTELDFADQPLSDVIDYLKERHNFEIRLDGESLRRANLATDVPITRTIKGIPLRSALGLMLEPLDLRCVVEGDALVIRSPTVVSLGTLELSVVDKQSGQPMPSRVHLRDASGSPQKANGLPFWKDHFVCPGMVSLDLPEGEYRYEVERGPEYTRAAGKATLVHGGKMGVTVELARVTDLPAEGYWPGDLHVHRPPGDIELLMQAEDLHVAPVITWWNNKDLWADQTLPTEPLVQFDRNRYYHLMAGEDEREGGALLYFNLPRPLAIAGSQREYPSPLTFLGQARQQPNVAVDVEKPFWWDVPVWLASGQVDSIGLANNHLCRSQMSEKEAWGKPRDDRRLPPPRGNGYWSQEIYYHILNCGLRIPPSAGSASGVLPNPVGYNRVYVHTGPDFSYQQWWRNLKAGRSFVTNGPLLRVEAAGELPGHVFTSPSGKELEIALTARLTTLDPISFIEIIRDGQIERRMPFDEFVKTGSLGTIGFESSGWFLVRAITDVPETFRFASTAPYYVEIGTKPNRISKRSAQFFLDWVRERMERIRLDDARQREEVLKHHRAAEEFWKARVAAAGGE